MVKHGTIFVCCFLSLNAAQEPEPPNLQRLVELMNTPVVVASRKPMNLRQSPGIVSLITRDEILDAGARDLTDVLRLVPGFDFGVDVQGVVGLGVRGNWGHEGKVLLLIDGHEMDETLYLGLPFGNHFPVEIIKRVEIIRGPGSAIYGGFAELAVINVITRDAAEIDGVSSAVTLGQGADSYLRQNFYAAYAHGADALSLTLQAFAGRGQRSARTYQDFQGKSYNMKDSSRLDPGMVSLNLESRGLELRFLYDNYRISTRDNFDQVVDRPSELSFETLSASIQYNWRVSECVTLIPRFSHKQQRPWHGSAVIPGDFSLGIPQQYTNYHKAAVRDMLGSILVWDPSANFNFQFGFEYTRDLSRSFDDTTVDFLASDDPRSVQFTNKALFSQALWNTRYGDLTLGARFDRHSHYGSSFVPRIAFTSKMDKFHYKILAAKAFKAPGLENIRLNGARQDIRPEHTTTIELEMGYQPTVTSILTVNYFSLALVDPIIYGYKDGQENYFNFDRTGTRGVEAEFRWRLPWGSIQTSISYYQAYKNQVEDYRVPSQEHALIGLAQIKGNLLATWHIYRGLILSPSVVVLGPRYGYDYSANVPQDPESASRKELRKFQSSSLINIYLRYLVPDTRFELGFGVYNLLNQSYVYLQPYNGNHGPLPGLDREFLLRAAYNF